MDVSVAEVAKALGGSVIGNAEQRLTGIASITEAGPGDISFLANDRYVSYLSETQASAVLVAHEQETREGLVQIVVENPDFAFASVVAEFGPKSSPLAPGIHPTAIIGKNVEIGENITIGAYSVIGDNVVLGDNCTIFPHVFVGSEAQIACDCSIYPHATIREGCHIGKRVIIHSGAVIGSDGFGYATVAGVHHKIPQVGIVVVEDDVEIGANTSIDRARFGKTVIGKGSKIDNLVQVAHNVEIGEGCILVAQVGIAGSSKLGRYVTIAGQSGISGHLKIGDQAMITARCGVAKNIPPKMTVMGFPATDIKTQRAKEIALRRLPRLMDTVKELEQRIAELEARNNSEGETPA